MRGKNREVWLTPKVGIWFESRGVKEESKIICLVFKRRVPRIIIRKGESFFLFGGVRRKSVESFCENGGS